MSAPEVWHGVQPAPADPPAPIGERVRRRSLLDPSPSKWDREVDGSAGSWTHFNRDDQRRQMLSMRVLEQLLKRAAAEDLPALEWTVTTSGSVAGALSLLDGRTLFQRREVFLAWATALGFTDWRDGRHFTDQVEQRGWVKVPAPGAPHLDVTVVVAVVSDLSDDAPVSTENA